MNISRVTRNSTFAKQMNNPAYLIIVWSQTDKYNRPFAKVFKTLHALEHFIANQATESSFSYSSFVQKSKAHYAPQWHYKDAEFSRIHTTLSDDKPLWADEREAAINYAPFEPIWWKLATFPINLWYFPRDLYEEGK